MIAMLIRADKTDQNAIANARLDGLEDDLGLTGSQFNVAVSVLYAGYTLIQIPSNLLMSSKRVRPSLWMAGWTVAWAVVSACTAAVHNYPTLVLVRTCCCPLCRAVAIADSCRRTSRAHRGSFL